MKQLIPLALVACFALCAQSPSGYFPATPYVSWYVGTRVVPGTPTHVAVPNTPGGNPPPSTVFVDMVVLVNVSASNVTVSITDASTNCNGGPCTLFPPAIIQPNQVYTIALNGAPANGGILWGASTGNAIHGSVRGRY